MGSWEGLKWSSVSLSPCEVTKQNFISALSNWTALITPVILFLPCVISLLGVKCLCAKLQSSWMPSLHRAAAPLSQASQRSRLHKIISAWMWWAHKWGMWGIRRIWRKRFLFLFAKFAAPVKLLISFLESSHQKLASAVHHLGITVNFLGVLIKISYTASRRNAAYLQ